MRNLLVIILLSFFWAPAEVRSDDDRSYLETRALLLEAETAPANGALRKLFREASQRQVALLRALDDPEVRVQLNALRIIDYVALPELNDGRAAWLTSLAGSNRIYARPTSEALETHITALTYRGNPADVARRYLFGNQRGSYKVIARNSVSRAVLVEVVFGDLPGNAFTEGWHVVLREEDSAWRPLLKTNVWVS